MLTGLRPSTTGIYGLVPGIRDVEVTKHRVTLPQTFTKAGYHTFTCGKIYHDKTIPLTDQPTEFNTWGPRTGQQLPPERISQLPLGALRAMDWGPYPQRDEETADYKIASAAVAALQNAPAEKPFFVACGFRLPHVPCLRREMVRPVP